jgi:hypothetical protein
MRRREFISLLGGAAAAWPFPARAQQPTRRVGMLIGYAENDPEIQARLAAFRQALEHSGWKEGLNVHIDYRYARHKMAADWIGHAHKHDRDAARLAQQRGRCGSRIADQHVGVQGDQFLSEDLRLIGAYRLAAGWPHNRLH